MTNLSRHCEERSDEAVSYFPGSLTAEIAVKTLTVQWSHNEIILFHLDISILLTIVYLKT